MIRALLVPGILAIAVLAGCDSDSDTNADQTPSSPPASSESSTTSPGGTSPVAGTTPCSTDMLSGAIVEGGGGAAGHDEVRIEFTNTSTQDCTLSGVPDVSFIGADGATIGAPAQREPSGTPQTVTLSPGGTADAALRIGRADNYDPGTCVPTPVAGFRVNPPGGNAAIDISDSRWTACSAPTVTLLAVKPVT